MVDAKTTLSEADYNLLLEYARKRDATLADVIREAIRTLILSEKDPTELPLAAQPPPPTSRERREHKAEGQAKTLWEKI
jgi:hypothetical protein